MDYPHDSTCTCPGCLQWDSFDRIYIDFAMEYSQQTLAHTLAEAVFADFPTKMPAQILVPILAKRHSVLEAEARRRGLPIPASPSDELEQLNVIANAPLSEEHHRIRCAWEGVYQLARFGLKLPECEFPDLTRVLFSQHVVTICSFAEGFASRVIRHLASAVPGPLQSWTSGKGAMRGATAAEILEQFVLERGYGSIDKKLQRLEKDFGFTIGVSPETRADVVELFLIRNCITHNAGRVSEAYVASGRAPTHVKISDLIDLQRATIEPLIDSLVDVVTGIYRNAAVTVLRKDPARLMYGSHRDIPPT